MKYFKNDTQITQDEFLQDISNALKDIASIYSREVVAEYSSAIITSLLKDKCVHIDSIVYTIKLR